jgi:hypothetical protein
MKTVKLRIIIKDSRKSISMVLFLQVTFRAVRGVAANYIKMSLKLCGISDY